MQDVSVKPALVIPTPPPALVKRIGKFLVSGGSAAAFNLLLLHGLVSYCGMRGGIREDVASFIAIEASGLLQFFLCRTWVWRKQPGVKASLWKELLAFHGTAATAIIGRQLLFTLLRTTGLHYLPNAMIGQALAAVYNYMLYDRVVFKKR